MGLRASDLDRIEPAEVPGAAPVGAAGDAQTGGSRMTTQQAEYCKLIASILRRRERQTAHPHPAPAPARVPRAMSLGSRNLSRNDRARMRAAKYAMVSRKTNKAWTPSSRESRYAESRGWAVVRYTRGWSPASREQAGTPRFNRCWATPRPALDLRIVCEAAASRATPSTPSGQARLREMGVSSPTQPAGHGAGPGRWRVVSRH
jgi:hypothetical protein